MRKKIAFKPHKTRGEEIIKILEGMGGVNKYNLDGSKGIIAIDYSSNKSITNDWDYCGLLLDGWEIYNLEGYENELCEKSPSSPTTGLVEEENKPKFKVGDVIISDALQLKWKVIDVERTGYILKPVDYPDMICDLDFKNEHYYKLVEEESEKKLSDESWKPSKEEMDVLYGLAYLTNQYDEHKEEIITRLYQDLKREFFNGSSYENMFHDTEDDVRRRSTIQVLEYARSLDNYNQYGKEDIDKNIAWLKKQGKKPQGKSALEVINEKNIDNQNCVKPTDKIEPKFKVGDKITNGEITFTILTLSSDRYGTEDTFGECGSVYFKSQDEWKIVEEKTSIKLTGKAIKNCEMVVSIDEWELPDGCIFKDERGNEIHATKIVLEKANTLKIQSDNMETETHRGYYTTEEETTNESKKVAWFTFGDNDFADKVELALSNRELIQENGKWFVVKKKKEYPKTYEECSLINGCENRISLKIIGEFTKLINARNAYWKLYGEEMELGKSWEPDYTNIDEKKFSIWVDFGEIKLGGPFTTTQMVLSFPTAEMRDFFYENFKEEIEKCKELL